METVETVEFLVKIRCIPRILLQESLLRNSGVNLNLIIITVLTVYFSKYKHSSLMSNSCYLYHSMPDIYEEFPVYHRVR